MNSAHKKRLLDVYFPAKMIKIGPLLAKLQLFKFRYIFFFLYVA